MSPDATKPKKQPRASSGRGIPRLFPKCTLEEALEIAQALKDKNGGNPWPPEDVAHSLDLNKTTDRFFYLAGSARDYGLTSGGRDSKEIELTPLGRSIVYASNKEEEDKLKRAAFLSVEKFKRVLEHYKGGQLPEMKYLSNTLTREFSLPEKTHEEFSKLFRSNCEYLGIGAGFTQEAIAIGTGGATRTVAGDIARDTVTLAEPKTETGLRVFVIMPFQERAPNHPKGFFAEVLQSLITPAGREAGFTVTTAIRQGSDVIQSTIVKELLEANLVIADLTEHNPNVLFELGLRMAFDKPVALIRAKGTDAIFDVDNMLRVFDYDPNMWPSTVQRDLPRLIEHIKASWENKDKAETYMKLLGKKPAGSPQS